MDIFFFLNIFLYLTILILNKKNFPINKREKNVKVNFNFFKFTGRPDVIKIVLNGIIKTLKIINRNLKINSFDT